MEDFNYRPNSNKFKEKQKEAAAEEKKKIEKVVSGSVKLKKQNELSKFAKSFISEDAKDIKSYVVNDIVIPTAKKVISEIIGDVTDIVLFGRRSKNSRTVGASRTSYRSFYDDRSRVVDRAETRPRFDYADIVFTNRGDAEAVLDELFLALKSYRVVTVADLYDAAGESAPYTSNKYGWTSLAGAEVQRVRDGYVIDLPRALPID
jgi:hypothetical protein